MTTTLAAFAGALAAIGLLLAVLGARPTAAPPRAPATVRRRRPRRSPSPGWARWRWPVAGGAGLLMWAVSGWPVAGALVTTTVVGLPVLLTTGAVSARRIGRVEAIEEWTRRLSDILVAGVGLEQALTASLRTCPPPLTTEVTALVARLSARWPTEQALRAFADDVDDAAADLVVAALVLASRRRGPGLARVLTAVADSVAEDVAVRRKVEAERAKPRTTARAVTLITLGVVAVGALNGTYLNPYAGPLGQLVLAAIATAFIGCLAWMRALTLSPPEPRFLTGRRVEGP
ncbi:type II secretion system F family protein [uncultured Cellulomonas sp.]|uniref:type II secretion system F family protein n=1 Tax=uncultured Cellulomonas sp. TaxID=189682 RepID=UPI002639B7E5|nr:type II secretion system F family protein [uncultured Cellulomonas sp.]